MRILPLVIGVFSLFGALNVHAADCYDCPNCKERSAWLHKPSNQAEGMDNATYEAIYQGVANQLFYLAPYNCIGVIDSGAPMGPSVGEGYNIDYEFYSDISGNAKDGYLIQTIVVSASREHVGMGQSHIFEGHAESAGQASVLSIEESSAGTRPLTDVLFDYEKKKRETERAAFNPKVEVKSYKSRIKREEKETIRIEVLDCDKKPLKQAKIEVRHDVGSVDRDEITTDENGIATVEFTAPKHGTAEAKVSFYYAYKRPSGRLGNADDYVTIEIEKLYLPQRLKGFVHVRTTKKYSTGGQEVIDATLTGAFDLDPSASRPFYRSESKMQLDWKVRGQTNDCSWEYQTGQEVSMISSYIAANLGGINENQVPYMGMVAAIPVTAQFKQRCLFPVTDGPARLELLDRSTDTVATMVIRGPNWIGPFVQTPFSKNFRGNTIMVNNDLTTEVDWMLNGIGQGPSIE